MVKASTLEPDSLGSNLAGLFIGFVNCGKLGRFPKPQCPHLQSGDANGPSLRMVLSAKCIDINIAPFRSFGWNCLQVLDKQLTLKGCTPKGQR